MLLFRLILAIVLCLALVPDNGWASGQYAKKPTPHTLYLPAAGGISSPFGLRILPGKRSGSRGHKGMDISAPQGTTVVAAGAGRVTYAGERNSYGNLIELDHGKDLVTRYAHLDRVDVAVGEVVELGQMIGLLGQTGRTTGPNLHFETIAHGRYVDPLRYIVTDVPISRPRAFTPRPGLRVPPAPPRHN